MAVAAGFDSRWRFLGRAVRMAASDMRGMALLHGTARQCFPQFQTSVEASTLDIVAGIMLITSAIGKGPTRQLTTASSEGSLAED
jgi:hypothetical protein